MIISICQNLVSVGPVQRKIKLPSPKSYLLKSLYPEILSSILMSRSNIRSNKAKGQISIRVFQQNKACQVFRKNENFLPPDTHTYVCIRG